MMIGMDGKAANLYCQYDHIYNEALSAKNAEDISQLVGSSDLNETTAPENPEKTPKKRSQMFTVPPACVLW